MLVFFLITFDECDFLFDLFVLVREGANVIGAHLVRSKASDIDT
jgi:hypothetical protein